MDRMMYQPTPEKKPAAGTLQRVQHPGGGSDVVQRNA
jgi:hypothetical protein